jgi:hypothetical protein
MLDPKFRDTLDARKHVLPPFPIPDDWTRFRSGDWGSASPFSIGWWAVVTDSHSVPNSAGGVVTLPRGAIVRYREDYGASGPGKGLKLTAEQVAGRIIERERNDPKLQTGVLDPSAWTEDGGPPIAERINLQLGAARMVPFRKADNARVARGGSHDRGGPMGGWDQMRSRMVGDGTTPMIFCFSTCHDSIRTIPTLQHDPMRAEDLDTSQEDHCADEWRYACMSRPWTKPLPQDDEKQQTGYVTHQSQGGDDYNPGTWGL